MHQLHERRNLHVHLNHVLLVENDPLVASAVARLLRARGFNVTVAKSCADAAAVDAKLEIGVFDIDLGDGLGTTCAAELVRRGVVRRCVFFTGGASRAELRTAASLGPVVAKGEVDELLRLLKQS